MNTYSCFLGKSVHGKAIIGVHDQTRITVHGRARMSVHDGQEYPKMARFNIFILLQQGMSAELTFVSPGAILCYE